MITCQHMCIKRKPKEVESNQGKFCESGFLDVVMEIFVGVLKYIFGKYCKS